MKIRGFNTIVHNEQSKTLIKTSKDEKPWTKLMHLPRKHQNLITTHQKNYV